MTDDPSKKKLTKRNIIAHTQKTEMDRRLDRLREFLINVEDIEALSKLETDVLLTKLMGQRAK